MATSKRLQSPADNRNMLIIGGIIVAAVVIGIIAIIVSSGGRGASGIDYAAIPQSRTADGAMVLGNPDAPITIIEFADFACPHCQDYTSTTHRVISDYVATGKAKFEYRMFITATDPQFGPYVSQLAECAEVQKPGAFWPAHDTLFQLGSQGRFNATTSRTLAERVDLNYSELLNCAETASQYTTDQQFGISLGVQSTPTIMVRYGDGAPQFINLDGRSYERGGVSFSVLQNVIEAAQ